MSNSQASLVPGHFCLAVLRKWILGALAWPTLLVCANSQQGFAETVIVDPQANEPQFTHLADLDQDGDLDMVCTLFIDDELCWYENLGGGVFGNRNVIASVDGAWALAVSDVDADGDLDIIASGYTQDVVFLAENLGVGAGFSSTMQSLGALDGPVGLELMDVDLDGLDDIVAIASNQGEVVWFKNLGGAQFQAPVHMYGPTPGFRPCWLDVGDADGDGVVDVFVASWSDDSISWFRGLGGGGFGGREYVTQSLDSARSVECLDADQDGDLDLVVVGLTGGVVRWYQNDGAGQFIGPTSIDLLGSARCAIPVDIDVDGVMDVVVCDDGFGRVVAYVNDGLGVFSELYSADLWQIQHCSFGDCDGDGDPDLVVSSYADRIGYVENLHLDDCDGDGVLDGVAIGAGVAMDLDDDGVVDCCQIEVDPLVDQDQDGILDSWTSAGGEWIYSEELSALVQMTAPVTWAEARVLAQSLGAHLVTVQSESENAWISQYFCGERLWLGLTDAPMEGVFEWHSQEPVLYANWAPGAPNAITADQDYVALDPATGYWDTYFSDSEYRALLESDSPDCDGDLTPDGSQISAEPDLDMNGDGQLDVCVPATYCTATVNSSGMAGTIAAVGSPLLADNALTLECAGLPAGQWSYFLMAATQDQVPNFGGSQGVLCLGQPIVRFNMPLTGQVAQTSAAGERSYTLDLSNLPQGTVFLAGESWNFQLWFRDLNPSITSNTTNGVTVMFR